MSCVLGRKETYQRRAASVNCYTGVDYDRPIKTEICPCDFNDYQCDFGFVREGNPYHCIRDKSVTFYALTLYRTLASLGHFTIELRVISR